MIVMNLRFQDKREIVNLRYHKTFSIFCAIFTDVITHAHCIYCTRSRFILNACASEFTVVANYVYNMNMLKNMKVMSTEK